MGDRITCISVLHKNIDPSREDYLTLTTGGWDGIRTIPCRAAGKPPVVPNEWVYEEVDGVLNLTPSLLCRSTGFHTDFNWTTAYSTCPEGVRPYDHFISLNPSADTVQ